MEGALHVVGEVGYRAASVRAVLEYSGAHRKQFYDHFDSLEDCFDQAYEAWIERLGVDLLEAALGAGGWRESVQAGLVRLFEFVVERPTIARSLFVEVQVAGGRRAGRARGGDGAARAGARQRPHRASRPTSSHPRPPAFFVVGGIEAGDLRRPRRGQPQPRLGRAARADAPDRRLLPGQRGGRSRPSKRRSGCVERRPRRGAGGDDAPASWSTATSRDPSEDGPFSAGTPLPHRLPPGRHGIPANLVTEHQRLRLIAAMGEALAEHGYAGVTTTHVSERARVSTSTFYKHFGNLWDCVLAAYVASADRLCERIEAACSARRAAALRRSPVGIEAALAFVAAEPAAGAADLRPAPLEATAIAAARRLLIARLAGMLRREPRRRGRRGSRPGLDERLIDASLAFVCTRISAGD